jgi:hypothetical protein
MFLNADVPVFYCLLRREFLYDQQSHQNEFEKVAVFGVASIPARAALFHVMTERGAQIARVPISALVWKTPAPQIPLDYLELWDNFSYEIAVTKFEFLKGLRCRTVFKDRQWYDGEYMFTLDWCGSETAEDVGEGGHKNAHILRLDNGCFAAQPNNRILWYEPAFITRPYAAGERPDFVTNSHIWKCEGVSKWATEDSQAMFYEITSVNGKGSGS